MKQIIALVFVGLFFIVANSCANKPNDGGTNVTTSSSVDEKGGVIHLTKATFKDLVFDFENNKEWKYNGTVPAILDFYADWCGPCKMLAPVLEDLQKQYGGKIQVYKINTETERELAATFGIQSLPTLVFIPMNEKPQAAMGFQPKEELEKIISEVLKVSK